jgi:phosphopantothenoylcysteine synthetase/decarboxylase
VTLLTSHPEVAEAQALRQSHAERAATCQTDDPSGEPVHCYRTFDDLHVAMADLIRRPGLDAVIHSAAVSDYQSAGVFAPANDTQFHEPDYHWESMTAEPPQLIDVSAGKVKSDAPELWLRLVRTPKLVDLIRTNWAFRGVLVKFKLEVGVSDERLLEIAAKSRAQSAADLIVANTLEDAASWAFVGPIDGAFHRIPRWTLAARIIDEVERLHRERSHG